MAENRRADHDGSHRLAFEKNKRKIFLTQDVCAICGQPVDKNLKYPHPLSATIDHIIPINRGGHPSAIDNLQLAHFTCNRQKADKILSSSKIPSPLGVDENKINNRVLPQSIDWASYRSQ